MTRLASGPPALARVVRTIGRRTLGVLVLLVVTVVLFLAMLGAALFTLITALWRPRPGRGRRVLALATVYSAIEIAGLAAAAWRWFRYAVDRDALRYRQGRIRALEKSLRVLRRAARRLGGLDVVLLDAPVEGRETGPPTLPTGPLIVCSRHGGIGGAFLLAHLLMSDHGRLPRPVLKRTLSWDPLIDTLLSGIPHAFVDPQPGDRSATTADIGTLARGMAADDALLIFPEGGNFTPRRRIHAIRRLRRRGLTAAAARAERRRNVLPPHPEGVLAAIEAAPEADVVFVTHAGLYHLQSAADVWRALPLPAPVVFTWWAVPTSEVPRQQEAQLRWLEDHWSRIDSWVAQYQ